MKMVLHRNGEPADNKMLVLFFIELAYLEAEPQMPNTIIQVLCTVPEAEGRMVRWWS